MKGLLSLIFCTVFLANSIVAQETHENRSVVISDARIDSLVNLHIEHSKKYPVFQGYRIQILKASGNDALATTEEAKTKFINKYSDANVYLTFDEPYYRVRVGDFRTRLEAEKFLRKISRKYPGAWVIQDYINFPKYKYEKL
ncbi:MAG: hypothetical protein CL661_06620 [Bacteroidetes bacterium]|mgnify:CR=1 FL=1|nr:hypothetical protein [Bacteroidota bacterium]|tara:strand:+ start:3257 stop:3682 length:426 start_codon:yes stop_codon:yes gene_type:complete